MSSIRATQRLHCYTSTPFLYPCLDTTWNRGARALHDASNQHAPAKRRNSTRHLSTSTNIPTGPDGTAVHEFDHLDPVASDYSSQPFIDSCTLSIGSGGGGHGCISFLRDKFIANGPPNGGDGGSGGSIYIQAVRGETSLHKIARRGIVKAGRGKNGQGSMKGGARGEDVLLTVPVGTIVRELSRLDPVEEEELQYKLSRRRKRRLEENVDDDSTGAWRRDKWLLYPGTLPKSWSTAEIPAVPRPRRSSLASLQPSKPLRLDLDKPMELPMLLAAGAMGGLGNPHFTTKALPWPKFALKGDEGMRINLQLELKLLADAALVGKPNAGKSTLLRAITRSRTRVGNWAFTTLSPNIGTVVLDSYVGRPTIDTKRTDGEPRTNFTIADIPGLIEDAHLDRGLGLGFLRHVERAAVLAFVVDLSAGDAVEALKSLWLELSEYERLLELEVNTESQQSAGPGETSSAFKPFNVLASSDVPAKPAGEPDAFVLDPPADRALPRLSLPPISSKPWMVVATKADLPGTEDNFAELQRYLIDIEAGGVEHPSGKCNAWRKRLHATPVSAINKEGVSGLAGSILDLLEN